MTLRFFALPLKVCTSAIVRAVAISVLCLSLAPMVFAEAADPKADAFFTTKVWPIIDNSCTSCHGADKQKAKLRLDSRAAWIKGGEDPIVVPGNPDKSLVIASIKHQTKDQDQYMPPKKKKQLTKEEIQTISDWIKMGMPWPEKK